MFLYTLYIFVFCITVQSSLGYNFGNVEEQNLFKDEHNKAASNDGTTTAVTVHNEKVCDKAVTLQKILGVMISMLSQDVSKNTKTAYVLETLKDLLRNTAGDNDEVMYKINDLMRTLDKYKQSGGNNDAKFRRVDSNKEKSPSQTINPIQKIILKYELPAVTNSYCTEALLSIIKIAYQAYVSLEKNPICNLPGLPGFPHIPSKNQQIPDFLKLLTPLKPQPGIWNDIFPTPYPSNKNPYYLYPNTQNIYNPNLGEVTENSGIEHPTQYKTTYEYRPNPHNIIPIDSQFLPYSPQYPNDLTPNQPNNPFVHEFQTPYPIEPIKNSPSTLNPYFPQDPGALPFDFSLPTARDPFSPYNPGFKPYPEVNPLTPPPFPWPTENPDFPFDKKPQSNPLNPYVPDTNYPQNIPKGSVFFPWVKRPEFPFKINPQQPYPNGPNENHQNIVVEIPTQPKPKRPDAFPFEVNPAVMNYLYPHNHNYYKYIFPQPLPSQPKSLTPEYTSLVTYSPDDTNSQPTVPNLFELPYQPSQSVSPYFPVHPLNPQNPLIPKNPSAPYQPGLAPGFFPVESLIQNFTPLIPYNPIRPYIINPNAKLPFGKLIDPEIPNINDHRLVEPEIPKTEIYEFNMYPNQLRPDVHPSYIPENNNPVYEFELNPNALSPNVAPIYPNIPIDQNPVHEFELNPNKAPMNPYNIPNSDRYKWAPNIPSAVTPQDLNPFFLPKPVTPTKTMQVPEFKIIGFIKDAIDIIEAMIPVVKFDPPTLIIIAKIKDIIFQKDKDGIEVEEFGNILELYKKLINYVKQLKIYKEIIDIIDLSRVTNPLELETKKVVELTYLVKRPQPVVYYPYYYVKYRLPYPSFVVAAQNLLRRKPHLRMNPKELYEELLALSKVAETSPDLKSYKKEDILSLIFKSGSLVDTKLIGANGTMNEQLNVLRDITSNLTAEDILELNKKASNQIQLLAINPETTDNHQTYKTNSLPRNVLLKNNVEINNGKQESQPQINHPTTQALRTESQANSYQNYPKTYSTTESNLDFTSFDSNKLRNDILQGEYVGMPISNYVIPTNNRPLNGINEPNLKINHRPIAPAMYKLFDATLKARYPQGVKQQNFMGSGGLVSLDNEIVSLNTGTANRQDSVNIFNPKIMINSLKPNPNIYNTKTSLDASNQQNLINQINDKVNQHNIWTNQENYYNSGGLLNFDDQKISLNAGTGNRQDYVNFMNPKVMINKPTDMFNFESSKAPADQQQFMNLNSFVYGIKRQDFPNGNTTNTKFGVTSQQGLQNAVTNAEAPKISHDNLGDFESKAVGLASQKGIMNVKIPNNIVEQNVGSTQISLNSGTGNEKEKADFIKKTVIEDIRQYADSNDSKNNYQSTSDGVTYRPTTSQDLTKHNKTTISLNTGNSNSQKLANFNSNQNILNAETENQSGGNFNSNTGMAGQQAIASQQNFDTGMAGQQATTSQQNFDIGMAGQPTITSQHNFDTGMTSQQGMASQQNFDTGMAGQPTMTSQQNLDTGMTSQQGMASQQNFDTGMAGQQTTTSQQNFDTGMTSQQAMASQQNFDTGMAGQQAMASQQNFDTEIAGQQAMAGQQNFDTEIAGQQAMAIQQNFDTGMLDQPVMASQQNFGTEVTGQLAMGIPQNYENFGINIGHSGHQLNNYVVQRVPIFFNRPTLQRFSLSTPSVLPFGNQLRRPVTIVG